MKSKGIVKGIILVSCFFFLALLVSGCTVRTYKVTKPREDQEISGNLGYIQGNIPAGEKIKETKKTRTIHVMEVELRPPVKIEKGISPAPKLTERPTPKVTERPEDSELWGNLGYMQTSPATKARESAKISRPGKEEIIIYTVKKGDTLQKISKHFYGTVNKWPQIYELNKDKLKSPQKIYPGQELKIAK